MNNSNKSSFANEEIVEELNYNKILFRILIIYNQGLQQQD